MIKGITPAYLGHLVSFRTFRCPIFTKPVTGHELFLVVSYGKPALTIDLMAQQKFTFF